MVFSFNKETPTLTLPKKLRLMIRIFLLCMVFSLVWTTLFSQITINLRRSFIDSFKNRLTIEAKNFEIYYSHKRPNSISADGKKDGDLHFSGYQRKIGMPLVAEIMNARMNSGAVEFVKLNQGQGVPQNKVDISGVWRLWCEHPGNINTFRQGNGPLEIEDTNPPHVFEIHPVTKIDTFNLLPTFLEIDGFGYKDATTAFNLYSNMRCKITRKQGRVHIETNGIGYNYVDFWIKFNDKPSTGKVTDGALVFCKIFDGEFDPDEEEESEYLISHKMRIGFVKGTDLYNIAMTKNKGDYMHIVGMPRINLAILAWRVDNATTRPEVLQWNLPLEMIGLGEIR